MDFIEMLLGRDTNKRIDDLGDVIGSGMKWLLRCGCLLLALIIGGVMLIIFGVVQLGENGVTTVIIIITMIVAVASLMRASLGY
jgi:uncharacterized membrane protein